MLERAQKVWIIASYFNGDQLRHRVGVRPGGIFRVIIERQFFVEHYPEGLGVASCSHHKDEPTDIVERLITSSSWVKQRKLKYISPFLVGIAFVALVALLIPHQCKSALARFIC